MDFRATECDGRINLPGGGYIELRYGVCRAAPGGGYALYGFLPAGEAAAEAAFGLALNGLRGALRGVDWRVGRRFVTARWGKASAGYDEEAGGVWLRVNAIERADRGEALLGALGGALGG